MHKLFYVVRDSVRVLLHMSLCIFTVVIYKLSVNDHLHQIRLLKQLHLYELFLRQDEELRHW